MFLNHISNINIRSKKLNLFLFWYFSLIWFQQGVNFLHIQLHIRVFEILLRYYVSLSLIEIFL